MGADANLQGRQVGKAIKLKKNFEGPSSTARKGAINYFTGSKLLKQGARVVATSSNCRPTDIFWSRLSRRGRPKAQAPCHPEMLCYLRIMLPQAEPLSLPVRQCAGIVSSQSTAAAVRLPPVAGPLILSDN
jgi:hypothetical protein